MFKLQVKDQVQHTTLNVSFPSTNLSQTIPVCFTCMVYRNYDIFTVSHIFEQLQHDRYLLLRDFCCGLARLLIQSSFTDDVKCHQ